MSLLYKTDSGADFSPCRRFRYRLWRQWSEGATLNLVGCNPSTAAEMKNDATASKVILLAQALGFGRLEITNAFAFVATDPKAMHAEHKAGRDVIGPDNDRWLLLSAKAAGMIICAWGMNAHLGGRSAVVENLLRRGEITRFMRPLHVLKLCKDGTPQHPLYLPKALRPYEWRYVK